MSNDILLHTYYVLRDNSLDSINDSLIKLEKILQSGKLLSKRRQGVKNNSMNYAGLDYISLADYTKRNMCDNDDYSDYNAYCMYSFNGFSFAFIKEDILYQEVKLEPIVSFDRSSMMNIGNKGISTIRYSDLIDEVQVKDELSLQKIIGLTVSLSHLCFIFNNDYEFIAKLLLKIEEILKRYNYNVLIYDVETLEKINSIHKIERQLKKSKY